MNFKKYLPFIIALIAVIIHYCYGGKEAKNNYINFNKSNLNDKLLGTDYYARGVKIIFKYNQYVFYPRTSDLNDNSIFNATTEIGDSIYKKPFQKILTLKKKNGKEYKYSFREFK
ncbi:hypothetical protein [Chryseobacterium sp. ISL-6]|uniref:hypothetical protein n=1 Tax=Chryseobacterium sp. ISL-6 TaxID=2819143 RepID=UPI001BECF7F0|nr:hypothetical protein [Chryseobacterium sp. ISL-6]MBT2623305.1 hypothetical protein [Chryseobacterium sp. ISL-6]